MKEGGRLTLWNVSSGPNSGPWNQSTLYNSQLWSGSFCSPQVWIQWTALCRVKGFSKRRPHCSFMKGIPRRHSLKGPLLHPLQHFQNLSSTFSITSRISFVSLCGCLKQSMWTSCHCFHTHTFIPCTKSYVCVQWTLVTLSLFDSACSNHHLV